MTFRSLVLLLVFLTCLSNEVVSGSGSDMEVKVEVCTEACRNVLGLEECVRESACYDQAGDILVACVDNCLYASIRCQFRCLDSFDSLMLPCRARCGPGEAGALANARPPYPAATANDDCRRQCFIQKFWAS